jgi:glycosyltransferase involved in cell wall biosynthesis
MLVIAGSGEESYVAGLRDRATELGLASDIIWTGFLSGMDKLSAFAAATVFILPSYSENFGIALTEAMAAGLPCLTTPGVALAEDVQARAADVLMVVPAEIKPLATALDHLLGDAALRAQLGANAKRMAAEQFTISSMGVALKKLYEEVLAAKTPHS